MAYQKLSIKSFGEFEAPKVAIRIERTADGLWYGTDGKFVARDKADLVDLTADPQEPTLVRADIDIVPAQFKNGRYTIYYYDLDFASTPRLFDIENVDIIDGSYQPQRIPTTTDTAVRILDARVGNTTFRNTMLLVQDLHQEVAAIRRAMKAQKDPAPSEDEAGSCEV